MEGVGADSALRTVCLELGMRAIVPELAADITPAQLRIKQIGGGITNKLVKCDYTAAGEDGATHTVLVRLFGENTEVPIMPSSYSIPAPMCSPCTHCGAVAY